MPLPLTVSCFSKIQIGVIFLVPAHPGTPGKGSLNGCVCVWCIFCCVWLHWVQQPLLTQSTVRGWASMQWTLLSVRILLLPYWCEWVKGFFWYQLTQVVRDTAPLNGCVCVCTHPFNGLLSGTTQVSRYQKGKTNLDFTEARDSEWQWHQLGHMCKSAHRSRQITTPAHHTQFFYRPDALPATQPTVSKHWRHLCVSM